MKKLFAILAIATAMVACNNEASTSTEDAAKMAADSTRAADSVAAAQKAAMDTANKMMADTTGKMMADTTKK
jgi:hypothetical protein